MCCGRWHTAWGNSLSRISSEQSQKHACDPSRVVDPAHLVLCNVVSHGEYESVQGGARMLTGRTRLDQPGNCGASAVLTADMPECAGRHPDPAGVVRHPGAGGRCAERVVRCDFC
jgi:hypothetical protein